jgi:hypothetical protein
MRKVKCYFSAFTLFFVVGCGILFSGCTRQPASVPVAFEKSGNGWNLVVWGTPTVIKGVGFDYTLGTDKPTADSATWFSYVTPDIAKAGANSIRTYGLPWSAADPTAQAALISGMLKVAADGSSSSNFITVLAGFIYDPTQGDMSSLIIQTMNILTSDPNFNHLVGFCIGNEIAVAQYPGLNTTIAAVKAAMVTPELTRPVMTAVANVSSGEVAIIQAQLPALDWLGINSFYGAYDAQHVFTGFLDNQANNLSTGGWTLPWTITEYYSYDLPAQPFPGFAGMPFQNLNGVPYYLELNSTLNAQNYTDSYSQYIVGSNAISKGSVGGFVLNWGPPHNSKLIAFWKEVYAYRGVLKPFVNPPYSVSGFDRLQATDAVAAMYGGSLSTLACPQIVLPADGDRQGIDCSFKATLTVNPTPVAQGANLTATVTATSSQSLTFDWYLVGGSSAGYTGDINAANQNPQDYVSTTTFFLGNGTTTPTAGTYSNTLTFIAPIGAAAGNNYQLRVVVRDGQGGAATAAIGFPME